MTIESNRDLNELKKAIAAAVPAAMDLYLVKPDRLFREVIADAAENFQAGPEQGMGLASNIRAEVTENAAVILNDDPKKLNDLEELLGKRKFGLQGYGASAVVLTFYDNEGDLQILRLTSVDEPQRLHARHVLEPDDGVRHKGINLFLVEPVVPFSELIRQGIISFSESDILNEQLSREVYQEAKLIYHDIRPENGSVSREGVFAIIESGAVHSEDEELAKIARFKKVPYLSNLGNKLEEKHRRLKESTNTETLNAPFQKGHQRKAITSDIFNGFCNAEKTRPTKNQKESLRNKTSTYHL